MQIFRSAETSLGCISPTNVTFSTYFGRTVLRPVWMARKAFVSLDDSLHEGFFASHSVPTLQKNTVSIMKILTLRLFLKLQATKMVPGTKPWLGSIPMVKLSRFGILVCPAHLMILFTADTPRSGPNRYTRFFSLLSTLKHGSRSLMRTYGAWRSRVQTLEVNAGRCLQAN